jgi:hypothetical protein
MRVRRIVIVAVACAIVGSVLYRETTDDAETVRPAGYSPTRPESASQSTASRSSQASGQARGSADVAVASERTSTKSERSMALTLDAPESVRAGERFSVRVMASASAPVARYAVTVSFDPSLLRAVSTADGNFMEQGSALAKFMQSTADGRGEIVFSAEQDGGAGVEGTGSVAVVEFQANAGGTASIELKAAEAFQGNGDAVRVTTEERRPLLIAR